MQRRDQSLPSPAGAKKSKKVSFWLCPFLPYKTPRPPIHVTQLPPSAYGMPLSRVLRRMPAAEYMIMCWAGNLGPPSPA